MANCWRLFGPVTIPLVRTVRFVAVWLRLNCRVKKKNNDMKLHQKQWKQNVTTTATTTYNCTSFIHSGSILFSVAFVVGSKKTNINEL